MEGRPSETGHVAERDRLCPRCGAKASIQFWESKEKQMKLTGGREPAWSRLKRPRCRKCGASFHRSQKFTMVR